jgi:succinate dehydrogenase/fumarate reductase flavoprotein subunit
MAKLDSKVPKGRLSEKWTNHKSNINLVSPANKRLIDVIVVGTGLAGASASATLAELGYNVKTFCFQDSPRRAHSIAAQGGINAAKNYQGDGDSTHRLFYDTIKGPMFTAWQRYLPILLTNVLLKAYHLPEIMEGFWTTVPLVGYWCPEHSMPKDRRANSCFWVPTRR